MKFCPVVPEICRGHVHVAKKERRIIIIIIVRNRAKTISLQTMFGRLNYRVLVIKNIESINSVWEKQFVEGKPFFVASLIVHLKLNLQYSGTCAIHHPTPEFSDIL
jgi:hypothetical protein